MKTHAGKKGHLLYRGPQAPGSLKVLPRSFSKLVSFMAHYVGSREFATEGTRKRNWDII